MAEFSKTYFEAQVVDGFYVRPMIKRAWAAQIKVLEEVVKICKRHNIKYYAEWGTLLGTVRHKGFIPWDDDLDIGMLREDYERFYRYAKTELPKDLKILSVYDDDHFEELLTRVVNTESIDISPEFMDKYYGCPYCVGIDIFVTDTIPRNKKDEEILLYLLYAVDSLGKEWNNPSYQEEKWEDLKEIEELTGRKIDVSKNIPNQLYQLADQISKMYGEKEGDEVALMVLLTGEGRYRLPKSYYETTIEMPFENIMMPVPVGYDQILQARYGKDYMIPVKRWGTHDYPFFKSQEKMLLNRIRREGVTQIPEYLDMMPEGNRERFYGLQFHDNLTKEALQNSGFDTLEVRVEDLEQLEKLKLTKRIQGISITAAFLLEIGVKEIIDACLALHASYFVIDTRDFFEAECLDEALTSEIENFRWKNIACYIETGYYTDRMGRNCRSMYSDSMWLCETIDAYNMLCGRDAFGICLNVGYANLLNMNLKAFVEETIGRLQLVHMNDNDGKENEQQLPLTFTSGRGNRSTDIFRLIGSLVKAEYHGGIVFDTAGLWENAPQDTQEGFLQLMQGLCKEWERQFRIRDRLGEKGKKLFLFGTGAMAYNYMCNWAQTFPPYKMIDNNKSKWGDEFCGVPIDSPDSIQEVPEGERKVLICNMYYGQVSNQLEQMGISYDLYDDNYYM